MANEFDYCVSLSILHPSIDPKVITAELPELKPTIEVMAGAERRDRKGNLITPPRKAMYSHWLAGLHPEGKLYSGDVPLSKFIRSRLGELASHRRFFSEIGQDGNVSLNVGLFSKSNYSAEVFDPETLKECGDMGVSIELNIYSNAQS